MNSVSSNAVAQILTNYAGIKYHTVYASDVDDFITQLFNYCRNHPEENLINGDWSGYYFYSAYSQVIVGVYTMVLLSMSNSQAWLLWGASSLEGSRVF